MRKRPKVHSEQSPISDLERQFGQANTANETSTTEAGIDEVLSEGAFMKAGSNVVVDDAVGEFIKCTGNLAMAIGVCAVCARETPLSDLGPQRLDTFPNPSHLRPATAHPAHD